MTTTPTHPTTTPWDRRRLLAGAGLALLGAPTVLGAQARSDDDGSTAAVATLILSRHAEKASEPAGDPALTDAGRRRARALAGLLAAVPVTRLLSTDTRRTRDTLAPLAAATGLPVAPYGPRDGATVLAGLGAGDVVVMAGHSNTVPALVAALGGRLDGLDARGFLPDDQYDRVILATLAVGRDDGPRALSVLDLRLAVPAD